MKSKKIISVLITIALLSSIVSLASAMPAFDEPLDFTLEVNDENYPGESGDGWTWDLSTKVLNLNGFDIYTYDTAILLPPDSSIVVTGDFYNTIRSDSGEGIKVYDGDLEIKGLGSLQIISNYSAVRVTGNLSISQLQALKIESEDKGLNVGPGKNYQVNSITEEITISEIDDGFDGNITIFDVDVVDITSKESGLRAVGNLVIDNVDTFQVVVNGSYSGAAGIRVGGGSYNSNSANGDAYITNVGSFFIESYHTSIRVIGDLFLENIDYANLVSHNHTGIRVGSGDGEIETESPGDVEIINCGEIWIDADHTGIRVTGDLMIDTVDLIQIEADHIGIRAGSSYSDWSFDNNWSQSESPGVVHIKNTTDFVIHFGYAGIRTHSDIWVYYSQNVVINQMEYNDIGIKSLYTYIPDGYGLYASAGDITLERSEVIVAANTIGVATGNVCRIQTDYYDVLDFQIQGEYNFLDQMTGGDINIIQSFVVSEVHETGIAAMTAGNASSIDETKRLINIQKAKIVEPEDGIVSDVNIGIFEVSDVRSNNVFIDQSIPWNNEIELIETFEDFAKTVVIFPVFSVVYDANTGAGSMEDSNSPYFYEDTAVVLENLFTKTGHVFIGFNTKADGSGEDYQPGDEITIVDDIILYAQYDINVYIVEFNDWDDTLIENKSVEHGATVVPPSEPVREGYLFSGWDKSLENITSNTTITATYELDMDYIENLVKKDEETKNPDDLETAREWVTLLDDGQVKDDFDERLDEVQRLIDETPEPGDVFPLSLVILLLTLSAIVVVFATKPSETIA